MIFIHTVHSEFLRELQVDARPETRFANVVGDWMLKVRIRRRKLAGQLQQARGLDELCADDVERMIRRRKLAGQLQQAEDWMSYVLMMLKE